MACATLVPKPGADTSLRKGRRMKRTAGLRTDGPSALYPYPCIASCVEQATSITHTS